MGSILDWKQGVENTGQEQVQLLESQGSGDAVPEKNFRDAMLELFRIHGILTGQELLQDAVRGRMREDAGQVLSVDVVEIIVDDVFDGNGESLEDVQVLGEGEASDFQGMCQQVQLAFELDRIDAVQAKGLVEEGQPFIDVVKGGPRNQT